ncbi:MAG: helix-turn-helix domain-containing protein [Opitutaceae bacterium]
MEAARAKLASLEQSIADELNKELAALPARYGFASTSQFVSAVNAAAGSGGSTGPVRGRRRGRPPGSTNSAKAAKPAVAKKGGRKRRTRAVITDETRAQVKKLVDAGKTGAEIAQALKISVPSVQNIKKALGLVKER